MKGASLDSRRSARISSSMHARGGAQRLIPTHHLRLGNQYAARHYVNTVRSHCSVLLIGSTTPADRKSAGACRQHRCFVVDPDCSDV